MKREGRFGPLFLIVILFSHTLWFSPIITTKMDRECLPYHFLDLFTTNFVESFFFLYHITQIERQ